MNDSNPLKVLFLLTSMPVGGAETLLVNLLRNFPPDRIKGEVACLKEAGPLGEAIAREFPVHPLRLRNKLDMTVIWRLARLMRARGIDAVVTVGCGDKMFWGRLAASVARVPVIVSALHSTGWPDGVGYFNRFLTPITDAFIAVADAHGAHLVAHEKFPRSKVYVIRNGVDTARFRPRPSDRSKLRRDLGIDENAPVGVLVAALRPEKHHRRFLRIAREVIQKIPYARFLLVGDGPLRSELEHYADELGIADATKFLGTRHDTPEILAASDLFLLTSDNEAYPVSILEAMASGLPVVASDVGSIREIVADGRTGYCVPADNEAAFAEHVMNLYGNSELRAEMGKLARADVELHGSLPQMVDGYVNLLSDLYRRKVVLSLRRQESSSIAAM